MQHQTVAEQLYNQCREAGHCHVLLDPQAGSPFSDQISALDKDLAPRIHLRDPLFAQTPEEAPLLLSLPLSELPFIEALAAHAQQEAVDLSSSTRSVCGFLQSPLPVTQLAPRLARALDLKVDGEGIYFRYFDPRVFHHMRRLLPEAAFGRMLHGVSRWSYFMWDGSLAVQDMPASSVSSTGGLRLAADQWQPFQTIEHFNATQRLFAQRGMQFKPSQTVEFFAQVHAARALGLVSPDDAAYYVACSHRAASPLSQHAAWPDVMALLKQEVPLREAVAHLCGISLSST
jgi:hypothetical protein